MSTEFSCGQANQLDLVDLLERIGHRPVKIRGDDYWYLSPLREEKTASFKVNRRMNVWYDHGTGKGGKLVDFGISYWNCTVKELLAKLGADREGRTVSFHPPSSGPAGEKKEALIEGRKIIIVSDSELKSPGLLKYLKSRQIPADIARQYCREVVFELYEKRQLAIGFKNPVGGYELRNQFFKGSSSPKEPRLIKNGEQKEPKELTVFEGFFSFLSFLTIQNYRPGLQDGFQNTQTDFLILNSLSFFEKSKGLMQKYPAINLCLDRDKAGIDCTKKALGWSEKFRDKSQLYEKHKDMNEWLKGLYSQDKKVTVRKGRSL